MSDGRIAHYEITAHLGSGGMGDVYQATDTKLGRAVALKFLPDVFAHEVTRAARFDREARALASLNHPHIAAIHGLEEFDGQRFLVMEFVPGQTLDDRIGRRPMPLDEALSIARQIAEALESAHEKGIVHRDLKPANVKITPDGQVKVLDFGLAKLVAGEGDQAEERSAARLADSPTLTAPATEAGVILGTAAYMAPEQARGRPVDRRADIFAFGCLLYEMLTGRPAFEGETVPDILSSVLQREPDWTRVPPDVPPSIRRLMRLCLEKDPKKRRQAAGDVRIDLEQALTEPAGASPAAAGRGWWLPHGAWIATAAVVTAALGIPAAVHLRERPPQVMRVQIVTPSTLEPSHFALSPDGRHLAFVASGSSSEAPQRLYLQTLDEQAAQPLPGTDGARLPFWSADSRAIGFFAAGELLRIDITGGRAQRLAPAANPQGGAWNADGTILFAPTTVSPLLSVPATGGEPVAATRLDSPRQSNHRRPSFLPGGRQFLFYAEGEADVAGIYLGSIDGGAPKRLTAASMAVPLPPDRVVFVQDEHLVARRLDAVRGELIGDPVTLATTVGATSFSVSTTGMVAHRASGGAPVRTTWFDREGSVVRHGPFYNALSLSPDGRYLATDRTVAGNRDVWIADLVRGGLTPFTRDLAIDGFPVWSPDGGQVVFESQRNGTFDLWIKPFGGAGEEQLLLDAGANEWPVDWSSDGRFVLYSRTDQNYRSADLWALAMTGDARTRIPVANTLFEERMGEFSPDGRWIAYETDESGRPEIVVQAFPTPSGRVSVSTGGGAAPRWSVDGKEIYFIAPDGMLMAVPVATTGSTFIPGSPVPLFFTHIVDQPFTFQYTVSSDGHFLVNNRQVELASAPPITLLLNWRP